MNTEDLIATLASEGAAARTRPRLAWPAPLLLAVALCLGALALAFGAPLQPLPVIGVAPFAMKLTFSLSVAVAAAAALKAAATPGRALRVLLITLAIPFAALLALAAMEIAAGAAQWPGGTWARCLASIAVGSLATFAATIMIARRLAPTRLRLTGAIAGLAASAAAASAYALWCPETNAVFLLSWYAGTMLVAAALGALAGPRLLRW